ncbi:MAG: DEAD/DEAH box helicase family protein [Balneolaceae bacterium]|nr:DEAD/DEAH box helicase family protein [Balneolaceae bacterium]
MEAKKLIDPLGGSTDKPYQELNEISIRKNSSKEKRLFDFFEIQEPKTIQKSSKPTISYKEPEYGLFDHQRKAARKLKELVFQGDRRRTLLHMPTGSGKTENYNEYYFGLPPK